MPARQAGARIQGAFFIDGMAEHVRFFVYDIPTTTFAIYCTAFFVGLTWLGIIFVKPIFLFIIGREPDINNLISHTTSGFSLFYGLLLGLLSVAVYQNFEKVSSAAFQEATDLASL